MSPLSTYSPRGCQVRPQIQKTIARKLQTSFAHPLRQIRFLLLELLDEFRVLLHVGRWSDRYDTQRRLIISRGQ